MKLIIDLDAELPAELQQKIRELDQLFNIDPVVQWIHARKDEVVSCSLANRFSTTRLVGGEVGLKDNVNHMLKVATEAGYKRGQLQIQFTQLENEFLILYFKAKSLMLDLEMAKMD